MVGDHYNVKPVSFLNLIHTKGYGAFIRKNDKKIVTAFFLLFVFMGYGMTKLNVDSNSIKYFGKETMVRSGSSFVEKELTGSMIYEVILDSKKREGAKSPEFLEKIVTFEKALRAEFPNITFTTSLKDIVERMHKVLNPQTTTTLPNKKEAVAQYLLLYSMSLPQGMELNDKIDTTERYLRLSLNSNIQDTSKDLAMIEWITQWWKNNSNYDATVNGQTTIFAYMQQSVLNTLFVSISMTLLLVLVVMFVMFKNLKMLALFILPNIAPIIFVAGVMGYLGINIDIGVAISASVILGIAVDDTIHFFSKYFSAIKEKSFEDSIDYVIGHSGNAMILTTFILSFTFMVFAFSSFVPNVNFAIVTIVALNLALLLDLVLLPALLSLGNSKGK
jgi:predicted RND superfamily exporter protein